MAQQFLYEKINTLKEYGQSIDFPDIINSGLSNKIDLRDYQKEAFSNFILYFENDKLRKNKQIHTLFHMATGSGKTVIMAGLILYLYTKGYRKFLFFVNQTNVLEKTIENFTNPLSSKYLFNESIEYLGNNIKIKKVNNFSTNILNDDIEIVFTTTQKLHLDLAQPKENSITHEEFENNKIVFISDESHHINTLTKMSSKTEESSVKSWESSVTRALSSNKDNIMLEFTATCDLKDANVLDKYIDKIVFNYPLISFRESGYTKDFQNFATYTDLWQRTIIALVMSEYRRFLFSDLKLNIKPVIMLKSQKISESKKFYDEFFNKIKNLTSYELMNLELFNIDKLNEAINYFKQKDETLELLEHSIKNSFTIEKSIIINGTSADNKESQLLVNSLEDVDNSIRIVFAVDMLNEGWDVLNLFDIVRLYDTRQGSGKAGKIATYTIKEAQLIGRGARYCPFVDGDEEYKFKRKYDNDITNKNRILETMYFHSKNDSKYISELKQALIATGLQPEELIKLEYKLKDEFKTSDFYKKSFVYSNKRVLKSTPNTLETSMRSKTYHYTDIENSGAISNLFSDEGKITNLKVNTEIIKLKEINYNILLGAIECYNELRFSVLKEKYPNLKSTKEFLTSDQFIGNSIIEIKYSHSKLTAKTVFLAVKNALGEVASHILKLKPQYEGSTDFIAKQLSEVLKDKIISLSTIDQNGGKGDSQNNCVNENYQLDLSKESWYVFNDNYGTSEEKLFIKYFKTHIEPLLKDKDLEYYVVRNERIPELAIYSFESGERFEPDFLLFLRKKSRYDDTTYQGFIEPKGSHLVENDSWKEEFLMQINEKNHISGLFADQYKIIGFPFFNQEQDKIEKFKSHIMNFITRI
ncbi:DEAD/DEAH box helicase family protein [Mycoplasmopsis californica]|nr:DEAD/DEAH box helicase family protein [Mycoplasmopsis californica]